MMACVHIYGEMSFNYIIKIFDVFPPTPPHHWIVNSQENAFKILFLRKIFIDLMIFFVYFQNFVLCISYPADPLGGLHYLPLKSSIFTLFKLLSLNIISNLKLVTTYLLIT